METKLMKCGCVANATRGTGEWVCLTHNETTELEKPSLEGRTASCGYCSKKTKSDYGLPFFSLREGVDSYYCGCFGWD